jgi:hypothetical protein
VIGQSVDNRYQAFADPQATGQIVGFQASFNLWRSSLIPGGTDTAGVYFAYGNANINVERPCHQPGCYRLCDDPYRHRRPQRLCGRRLLDPLRPSGWYTDAVIQGAGYHGRATTQFADLPLNGSVFVSSLEAGYPFPWFGPTFVLEPQGEIIGQEVTFSAAMTAWVRSIWVPSSFTGRLGLRGHVDVHRSQRNGVAALRAGQRLARLGRRGDDDVWR